MIGRLDIDEWLEAHETDGMRRCREMERDWNSTQVKNGFIEVWKFNVNVSCPSPWMSSLFSSSVSWSPLPAKKEVIYCTCVCVLSQVPVSYNKVVTDLTNQQTVLYLRQPEHRGDLCLTDGCGVCVCARMHVLTLYVSLDEMLQLHVCTWAYSDLFVFTHMNVFSLYLSVS